MSEWLARARLMLVPNVPNAPKLASEPHFGTYGTIGTKDVTAPAYEGAAEPPSLATAADLAMEAEERAAILEYDAGLPRIEAERLAFGRQPLPGITIRAPAVEVSADEYDRHLDALIAAAGAGTPEASRLSYAKPKGWVVLHGAETIYTRRR